jgi:hypothetical protein
MFLYTNIPHSLSLSKAEKANTYLVVGVTCHDVAGAGTNKFGKVNGDVNTVVMCMYSLCLVSTFQLHC